MNSRMIQRAIFSHHGQASALMIPNYTPDHWFEADMIRVTAAGFMEEYEIKISVSDFKADALKGPSDRDKQFYQSFAPGSKTFQNFDPRTKHERLAAGDTRGPCRFYFAMPEEIAAKVVIPEWAGLVTFRPWRGQALMNRPSNQDSPTYKRPRQLHRGKACDEMMKHARGVFYYRYWNIRNGVREEAAS